MRRIMLVIGAAVAMLFGGLTFLASPALAGTPSGASVYSVSAGAITLSAPTGIGYADPVNQARWRYVICDTDCTYSYTANSASFQDPTVVSLSSGDYTLTLITGYDDVVDQDSFTIEGGAVVTTTPVKPTQSGNYLTIPSVTGVTYSVGSSPVTGVYTMTKNTTVSAMANDGYTFPAGTTSSWSFTYTAPKPPALAIKSATLKVKKVPTHKRPGKAVFTVASVSGAKVSGKAVLVIKKGKTTKRVSFAVNGTATTVKVPKLKKGVWKFQVQFQANDHFKAKNTKTYKVKVKK